MSAHPAPLPTVGPESKPEPVPRPDQHPPPSVPLRDHPPSPKRKERTRTDDSSFRNNHSSSNPMPPHPERERKSPPSEHTQDETSKSTAARRNARRRDDPPSKRRTSSNTIAHSNIDNDKLRVTTPPPPPTATASAHLISQPVLQRDVQQTHALPGSLDEYRESCLKLEKARHARVYEAEKNKLYSERAIQHTFDHEVHLAWDDYESNRRNVLYRMLQENLEKVRRVEELRYKIVRDDTAVWQRRHEMSLRQRGGNEDEFGRSVDEGDDKPRRTRKNDAKNAQQPRVKVQLHLDENDILMDLAEMTGEKRVREAESVPERRSKKRK